MSTAQDNGYTVIITDISVGPQGPPGPPGPPGPSLAVDKYIAAIDLAGHKVLTINNEGKAIYASNDVLEHSYKIIGISSSAALQNTEISVISYGKVTEPSWSWEVGKPIYLGLVGELTQSVPTAPQAKFIIRIGISLSPTTMFVSFGIPIELN